MPGPGWRRTPVADGRTSSSRRCCSDQARASLAVTAALRLAGHLAELPWLAAPEDPGIGRVRHEVFTARADGATSTMATGVFRWAASMPMLFAPCRRRSGPRGRMSCGNCSGATAFRSALYPAGSPESQRLLEEAGQRGRPCRRRCYSMGGAWPRWSWSLRRSAARPARNH